jgi:RimJ/RimL family protein N-acetyltransferase
MNIKSLETDRLQLRAAVSEDAAFILELLNSPGWLEYIGDRGVRSLNQATVYIKNRLIRSYQRDGHGLLVVMMKDTDQAIGLCGLLKREYLDAPDLGFAVLPAYEGKRYISEASRAILDHGFNQLQLEKIHATTKPSNQRSKYLLQHLGFRFIEDRKLGTSKCESSVFTLYA